MKATTQSGSVSVGGLEHPINDGHVDVGEDCVKQLLEHGFVLVGEVKRPINAKGENGEIEIFTSMPRKQFVGILRSLGVAVAEETPEEVLVKALTQRAEEINSGLVGQPDDAVDFHAAQAVRGHPAQPRRGQLDELEQSLDATGPSVGSQPSPGKSTFSARPPKQQRARR
jgi:hypothetical protein